MAEIKSTLDLVLERTRHLSLTADEKKEHHTRSVKQKCRGLVQRYGDKAINAEQLRRELAVLERDDPHYHATLLFEVILEMLDLVGGTPGLDDLLGQLFRVDLRPLVQVGQDYRRAREAAEARRRDQARAELDDFGISGSAVVACLDGDRPWIRIQESLQAEYGQRLEREKQRLRGMIDQM